MKRKVLMQFDPKTKRWCVKLEERTYGFHCGENMEIYIGGEPLLCRLELDRQWYIILKDVRFNLRPNEYFGAVEPLC